MQWSTDGDVPTVVTESIASGRAPTGPTPNRRCRSSGATPGSATWSTTTTGSPRALLDWEMASIGPAELDLAWFVGLHAMSARRPSGDLPGFVGHDAALALWRTVSAVPSSTTDGSRC